MSRPFRISSRMISHATTRCVMGYFLKAFGSPLSTRLSLNFFGSFPRDWGRVQEKIKRQSFGSEACGDFRAIAMVLVDATGFVLKEDSRLRSLPATVGTPDFHAHHVKRSIS